MNSFSIPQTQQLAAKCGLSVTFIKSPSMMDKQYLLESSYEDDGVDTCIIFSLYKTLPEAPEYFTLVECFKHHNSASDEAKKIIASHESFRKIIDRSMTEFPSSFRGAA